MNKKVFSFLLTCIFFIFGNTISLVANSQSTDDGSFYALSSLNFFLQQSLNDLESDSKNKIIFEGSDVENLWLRAKRNSLIQNPLEEAHHFYLQSLNQAESKSAQQNCRQKASHIVENLWQQLNPYVVNSRFNINQKKKVKYPNFDDNPLITKEMRKIMKPYLLPLKHPMRRVLEEIFTVYRVIENENSFLLAGFQVLYHQPFSRIKVAKHLKLPGYLLKVYFDSDPYTIRTRDCWFRLTQRCMGAENVRNLIQSKHLIYFTVPDKWLYPLPINSLPHELDPDQQKNQDPLPQPQPVLLVVTDMNLASIDETVQAWLHNITTRHLDELYCILSHGFASGFITINIPYCKNGKFACVDTENPTRGVNLEHVKSFLSPEMQLYWDELVKTGGKIN